MVSAFDVLQVLFWATTYFIIDYNLIRYRNERAMYKPLFPGLLDLSWEVNAAILSGGFWGHVLWVSLELVIFVFNVLLLKKWLNRVCYFLFFIILLICFYCVFRFPNTDGMLISVFIIDFILALVYIVQIKKISKHGKIPVAITKLLGDVCAWFVYKDAMSFVMIIGIVVFSLNLFYLCMCIEERAGSLRNERIVNAK